MQRTSQGINFFLNSIKYEQEEDTEELDYDSGSVYSLTQK